VFPCDRRLAPHKALRSWNALDQTRSPGPSQPLLRFGNLGKSVGKFLLPHCRAGKLGKKMLAELAGIMNASGFLPVQSLRPFRVPCPTCYAQCCSCHCYLTRQMYCSPHINTRPYWTISCVNHQSLIYAWQIDARCTYKKCKPPCLACFDVRVHWGGLSFP